MSPDYDADALETLREQLVELSIRDAKKAGATYDDVRGLLTEEPTPDLDRDVLPPRRRIQGTPMKMGSGETLDEFLRSGRTYRPPPPRTPRVESPADTVEPVSNLGRTTVRSASQRRGEGGLTPAKRQAVVDEWLENKRQAGKLPREGERRCVYCREPFRPPPRGRGKYCSARCRGLASEEARAA